MPEISKITLPSGNTYDIKDQYARDLIAEIGNFTEWLGVTTTAISDGSTTNPITINGASVTATNGDIVTYQSKEFIWSQPSGGTGKWQIFGDLSGLGALAYKNSASASYKPAGTVSQPTFTGSASDLSITVAANANGNYTPTGTVSQPTFSGSSTTSTGKFTPSGSISVSTATTSNKTATVAPASSGTATYTPAGSVSGTGVTLNTTTVNSITAVGTLPSCTLPTYTVANETLTITAGSFSAGTLPTKGSNTTVATSVKSVTDPTFSGTGVRLVTGNIPVPATYSGSFAGTEGNISVTGTPSGTVSQPTFSGTKVKIGGTTTAAGSVSQPTFNGTQTTITVS